MFSTWTCDKRSVQILNTYSQISNQIDQTMDVWIVDKHYNAGFINSTQVNVATCYINNRVQNEYFDYFCYLNLLYQ